MIPPTQEMPEQEMPEEAEGTEICIAIAPDGSMSVYLERAGEEQERQAVPDIGGALRKVLDLYKKEAAGTDDSAQFDEGFSGNKPQAMAQQKPQGYI